MRDKSRNNVLKNLGLFIVIVSIIFTTVVGGFALAHIDNVGRLIHVVQLINNKYLEDVTVEQLINGATKGIVDSLEDPYSVYMNAQENEQLMQQIEGKIGGVGIILNVENPSRLEVLRAIKNTPAEKAGIQSGDIILKVDNKEVSTIGNDQAVAYMRGDPGTKVTLEVYRESTNQNLTIPLTREKITVPTVDAEPLPGNPGIAYVSISQFSFNTAYELAEAFDQLEINKYKGLILDLRYNNGGEIGSAVGVASFFVPQGPVVYTVDKHGNSATRSSEGNYLDMPLVVLVNEKSASAAEIVSGAIKDYGTGTIVGAKTFGKGIVQTIYQLDHGTSVKLTTAKYLTPKKVDIHKKGIEPDVKVELNKGEDPTISPKSTKFDSQLTTALEVLLTKIKNQ